MLVKRRIDVILLVFIILCSTSFYKFSMLGPLQKGTELLGGILIIVLIIFHMVYSTQKSVKQNFAIALVLIILSMLSSMLTAYFLRDQRIMQTLFAQRAIYYYLLYFLLHQMKFNIQDLEKVIVFFALIYIGLHFIQTIIYPSILFDGNIRADRGTIRIYLPGAHYIAIAFYLFFQRFLRSNRFSYLVILLVILSVYIMRGGRQPLAILVLTISLFLMIDRRVKSRIFLGIIGLTAAVSIFFLFQNIFMEMMTASQKQASLGEEYIRFRTARYYLTDFFESPVAYITGNGMFFPHSSYGKLIAYNAILYHYHLGDIGLAGNYAIYGLFFVLGVLIICFRALKLKTESQFTYIKYYIFAVILSTILGGGFGQSDFIVLIVILIYMIDVSHNNYLANLKTEQFI